MTLILSVFSSEKSALENLRRSLNEQIEALNTENERLQAANAELQRQRDNLEDEKEDREKDMERQQKEIGRRYVENSENLFTFFPKYVNDFFDRNIWPIQPMFLPVLWDLGMSHIYLPVYHTVQ